MRKLEGAVRSYAWGSRTAIAQLRGKPNPCPHPEAELWFGAHPADPATVLGPAGAPDQSLLSLIDADPVGELGDAAGYFGNRLPFLLKVLAAGEPLSLQAHPSLDQAKTGFARENRLRVPLDSPVRNYKDDNHKPELVVALGRFEALAGFADPHTTLELLSGLRVPELDRYSGLLAGQPDAAGLRALFTTWITLPSAAMAALWPRVLDGCKRYLAEAGGGAHTQRVRTAVELADRYPGDAGVLAALLLNRVTLRPGEALFLAAGNLHAYLSGLAVEIMANSDNVLRGGLTPKHVDVPELVRVLDFEPVPDPVIEPVPCGPGQLRYPTPVREFALCRAEVTDRDAVAVTEPGPNIVLCTDGAAELRSGRETLTLERGAAAWVSAADSEVTARAVGNTPAQVFTASVAL